MVHMAVAAAILQVLHSKSLCSGYGMGCGVLGHAAVLYIADGEGGCPASKAFERVDREQWLLCMRADRHLVQQARSDMHGL